MVSEVSTALTRLDEWLIRHDYTGWDPYDGLGSIWSKVPGSRCKQGVVQVIKRLPPIGRRMLAVPQHRMVKTLSLVVAGLAQAPWLRDSDERRKSLIGEIRMRRGVHAWGYEFDVQTRWGFYPAKSPNAIVTAFATEAVHKHLNSVERQAIADWLTGEMWTGSHFRYAPGNDTCIHNANVLAARALHRLSPGDPLVIAALERTLERLPDGGLWTYGDEPALAWVDNFHTAYILDALLDLVDAYPSLGQVLDVASGRYLSQCFDSAGAPQYYAGGGGRLDVHNTATALSVLARLSGAGLVSSGSVTPALTAALSMERRPGEYASSAAAVTFLRWNQAHMHKALAEVSR
jgi:hypothetical protein